MRETVTVKIRPLLRKFQVSLGLHGPPSPTGLIIEYTHTNTHIHTHSYKHTQPTRSPVVRRHWWRVLVGIISPAVLSHPQSPGPHSPPTSSDFFPFLPNPLFLSSSQCHGSFPFLFPLKWKSEFCLFFSFRYFKLRPADLWAGLLLL